MLTISTVDNLSLSSLEAKMIHPQFLAEELRTHHTATYPLHNRYFSNGDKPWVILVNLKNEMLLNYDNKDYIIKENEFVLFDDNIMHAWQMKNNDLKIYYYRAKSENPIREGSYCLDDYF